MTGVSSTVDMIDTISIVEANEAYQNARIPYSSALDSGCTLLHQYVKRPDANEHMIYYLLQLPEIDLYIKDDRGYDSLHCLIHDYADVLSAAVTQWIAGFGIATFKKRMCRMLIG